MSKVAKIITDNLITQIRESGELPWTRPWKVRGTVCKSFKGHTYRGVNVWLTLLSGRTGPWITLKQTLALGGRVKRDEFNNATLVVFFKFLKKEERQSDGTKKNKTIHIPLMRFYKVWSLEQTEGIDPEEYPAWLKEATTGEAIDPIEAGEAIWDGYENGPTLGFGGDRAYYRPSTDEIQMPEREQFKGAPEYYSTLFHEMTHSTGHKSRLARFSDEQVCNGSSLEDYSKEELIAEMGAAFLLAEAGIECEHAQKNNAAYLKNWMSKIQAEPEILLKASSKAQRAVDRILGKTWSEDD